MTTEIFLTGLLAVSLFTTLGTQAVKKLLIQYCFYRGISIALCMLCDNYES